MKRKNAVAGAEEILKRLRENVPEDIVVALELNKELLKRLIFSFIIRRWNDFATEIQELDPVVVYHIYLRLIDINPHTDITVDQIFDQYEIWVMQLKGLFNSRNRGYRGPRYMLNRDENEKFSRVIGNALDAMNITRYNPRWMTFAVRLLSEANIYPGPKVAKKVWSISINFIKPK